MITKLKSTALFTLVLACSLYNAKPLSETAAQAISIGGGAVVGASAAYGTYRATEHTFNNETIHLIASALVGAGAGGLTWYILDQWLWAKTPTARIATAMLLLNAAARAVQSTETDFKTTFADKVVTKNFATDTAFIANVNARFGTSWPLVRGREYLTNLPKQFSNKVNSIKALVAQAQEPLGWAMSEMHSNPANYAYLINEGEKLNAASKTVLNQCAILSQSVIELSEVIEAPLITIVQHPNFNFQVDLYEKHLEAERQRRHAEEEARRHREHQLTMQDKDHSHDSVERRGDRTHDSVERQRDRYHNSRESFDKRRQQDRLVIQNPNRPMILNVG